MDRDCCSRNFFATRSCSWAAPRLGSGTCAPLRFQSPDSGYMGVEVHANIIDNLLHSKEKGRTFLTRGFNEEMVT